MIFNSNARRAVGFTICLGLSACASTSGGSSSGSSSGNPLTGIDLEVGYGEAVRCVDREYTSLGAGSPVDGAALSAALDRCDDNIEYYANMLADKALKDNGWGRYTQSVPYDTKITMAASIRESLAAYYEGDT